MENQENKEKRRGLEKISISVHKYGVAPGASMRRAGQAHDCGVLSHTAKECGKAGDDCVKRRSNATVFLN